MDNQDARVPLTKEAVCKILNLDEGQKIPTKLNKLATKRFSRQPRWYLDDVDRFLESEWQKHIRARGLENSQIKENGINSTGGAQSPKESELNQHALKIINSRLKF